jgi:hypothetical protein
MADSLLKKLACSPTVCMQHNTVQAEEVFQLCVHDYSDIKHRIYKIKLKYRLGITLVPYHKFTVQYTSY